MNKKIEVIKKTKDNMHVKDSIKTNYEYAINFGLIGSVFLIIISTFSYAFLTLPISFNKVYYFIFILVLIVFLHYRY